MDRGETASRQERRLAQTQLDVARRREAMQEVAEGCRKWQQGYIVMRGEYRTPRTPELAADLTWGLYRAYAKHH